MWKPVEEKKMINKTDFTGKNNAKQQTVPVVY